MLHSLRTVLAIRHNNHSGMGYHHFGIDEKSEYAAVAELVDATDLKLNLLA